MSVLGSIMSEVFHGGGAAPGPAGEAPQPGLPNPPQPAPDAPGPDAPAANADTPSTTEAAPTQAVDVEQVLDARGSDGGGSAGDWRRSPKALLQLLKLDSGPDTVRGLAEELHAPEGDDTAIMRALWRRLAEAGGKVPDDLRA